MDPQLQQSGTPEIFQTPIPVSPSGEHKLSPSKWVIIGILLLFFLSTIILGIFMFNKQKTASPAVTENSGVPKPAKTTDLAPSIPNSQKTTVIIENSDSSLEKVLIPTNQVNAYMKALPQGVRVVSQSSADQ